MSQLHITSYRVVDIEKASLVNMISNTNNITSGGECVISFKTSIQFEDYPQNRPSPVRVVNDTIKVKEYLLEDDAPYAFRYRGSDYIITKSKGSIKMYEAGG